MSIQITRQELYNRVWTEPIRKLSAALGLSDVGLAKICRRYNIPVPPRGYWAKKQAGKRIKKPELPPKGREGYSDTISLQGPIVNAVEPPAPLSQPLHPLVAAEASPENAIVVPIDLKVRHPLLQSTRQFWRLVKQPAFRWGTPVPAHINIDVASESQSRALRLLQALFTALEGRGSKISAGERHQVQVTVLDEKCELFLRERQRQVRRTLNESLRETPLGERPSPYGLAYSGELEFRIEKRYGRDTIRDRKNCLLEQQLNSVVVSLIKAALTEKEYRAEQERRRLEQEERERRHATLKERAKEEHARTKRLEQLIAAVDHHRRLVAFTHELRSAVGDVDANSELARWLDWVDTRVEHADVLRRFRQRAPTLTLYYCAMTYEAAGIVENGFRNRGPEYGDDQELPASVVLTDVPMEGIYGGTICVVVEMPEEAALPYESPLERKAYRRFRIPADVVNRFERRLD